MFRLLTNRNVKQIQIRRASNHYEAKLLVTQKVNELKAPASCIKNKINFSFLCKLGFNNFQHTSTYSGTCLSNSQQGRYGLEGKCFIPYTQLLLFMAQLLF